MVTSVCDAARLPRPAIATPFVFASLSGNSSASTHTFEEALIVPPPM